MPEDDLERSQRLFQWLAEEEPPQHFDPTHAGKTAPKSVRLASVSLEIPPYLPKPFYRRHGFSQVMKWLSLLLIGLFWFAFLAWFLLRLAGLLPRILADEPAPAPVILPAPPILMPQDTLQNWLGHPLSTPLPRLRQQDSVQTVGLLEKRLGAIWVSASGKNWQELAADYDLLPCTLITANDPRVVLTGVGDWRILPANGIEYEVRESLTLAQLAQKMGVAAEYFRWHDANPSLWRADLDSPLKVGLRVFIPTVHFRNCHPWERPPWLENEDRAWRSLLGCDYENPYRGYPTNAPMRDYRLVKNFDPQIHYGVDMIAPENTPVYAAGQGVVRWAGWHPDGYGFTVVLDHGGSHTLYAHLKDFIVSCGQVVAAQQLIAGVGSSGNADGNHLHFELRNGGFMPVDPIYIISLGFPDETDS